MLTQVFRFVNEDSSYTFLKPDSEEFAGMLLLITQTAYGDIDTAMVSVEQAKDIMPENEYSLLVEFNNNKNQQL